LALPKPLSMQNFFPLAANISAFHSPFKYIDIEAPEEAN